MVSYFFIFILMPGIEVDKLCNIAYSSVLKVNNSPLSIEQREEELAMSSSNLRQTWREFYHQFFGITVDFSDVVIPDDPGGFERVIFISQGLTYADIVKVLKKNFKVHLRMTDLDESFIDDVRTSDQSYAIRIRDKQEADEKWAHTIISQFEEKGINSITLMERLIYELRYYDETGEHLDIQSVTLCAGSHDFIGIIPEVRWHDARSRDTAGIIPEALWHGMGLRVYWCDSESTTGFLRIREVVS